MKKILLMLFVTTTITKIIQAQVAPFKTGDKVAITKFSIADDAGLFNEQMAKCCSDGNDSAAIRTFEAIVRSAEVLLTEKYKIEILPTEVKPNNNEKIKVRDEANSLPLIESKNAVKLGYDKFIEVYVSLTATAGAAMGLGFVRLGSGKAKIKVMYKIYNGNGKMISFTKPVTAKGDDKFKVRGFMISNTYDVGSVGGKSRNNIQPKKSIPGDEYVILFQEAFAECLGLK